VTQGNYKGAVSVMGRAIEYLEPYRPAREGIDVGALSGALQAAVAECRRAMAEDRPAEVTMIKLRLGREA
ncbi:MAG TPA: hypothetical protein VI011_10015, partial [Asanoa sp.]